MRVRQYVKGMKYACGVIAICMANALVLLTCYGRPDVRAFEVPREVRACVVQQNLMLFGSRQLPIHVSPVPFSRKLSNGTIESGTLDQASSQQYYESQESGVVSECEVQSGVAHWGKRASVLDGLVFASRSYLNIANYRLSGETRLL